MPAFYPYIITLFIFIFISSNGNAQIKNGFDLKGSLVPPEEILHGGPPRDGIPSIDNPQFIDIEEANFLHDNDRVIGIAQGKVARAYPVRILNWHEIVNDTFDGKPVVISYCPLCGTGMAFSSEIEGRDLTFGVSGLLYNSDLIMYDRETNSLWSQVLGKAISGPLKGNELTAVPVSNTTWADWTQRYPETQVLSTETGFIRDYNRTPYSGYQQSSSLYFPVANNDPAYHPKEMIIGLAVDGEAKAYPFTELKKAGGEVEDEVGGNPVKVIYDKKSDSAVILDTEGKELPGIVSFWFAWVAFYPDTKSFNAKDYKNGVLD